ncbi:MULTISPECIES: hypothetical protein [unclassified Streptomyces]|uniref:hypothetical protein n=1 Tax=unclassified Streptomyces TaxID=2593676 RepID=UPI0036538376
MVEGAGPLAGVGRLMTGRDLRPGDARSSADFWRPGVPIDRDAGVTMLGGSVRPEGDRGGLVAGTVRGLVAGPGLWRCWPHAGRAAVRWGAVGSGAAWWAGVPEVAVGTGGVLGAVALGAAATGPEALAWWAPRQPTPTQLYRPGIWAVVREILHLSPKARARHWIQIPGDVSAGAAVVVKLPAEWPGGEAGMRALDAAVAGKLPGEWAAQWHRAEAAPYVRWTRKHPPKTIPTLPSFVPWRPTGDVNSIFVGQGVRGFEFEEVVIHTKSATPHFGVAGLTGSGKSTVLYAALVHARQNGVLVDVADTKQNSLGAAEGFSGVRIHKSAAECVAALGEYIVSMQAAETAIGKRGNPELRKLVQPRLFIFDELPTLMKMALIWWKYSVKGRSTPPFADWFSIGLLQGRSADHRFGVGAQQWANSYFGGTMERAQIGWKAQLGYCDYPSWVVAFGASVQVMAPDTSVPGRGVFADGSINPESKGLWVREFQPCYITPEVPELLSECAPAPEWFDAGQMAPWITKEALKKSQELAIPEFLVGGRYGPAEPVLGGPVTLAQSVGSGGPLPRSEAVTGATVTGAVTGSVTAVDQGRSGGGPSQPEAVEIELFNLREACDAGILPWEYETARTYRMRSPKKGIPFPVGENDGRVSYYTRDELSAWLELWLKVVKKK